MLIKKGTAIYILPDEINNKAAAPINCTHATMAGALRLAGNVKGKDIAIIGVGMLGLSACAMVRENGAKHVIAIDFNTARLQRALEFGADAVIESQKDVDEWQQLPKSLSSFDVVIDTSGNPGAIEKGISLLKIGGICVIVGAVYTQRNISVNAEKIVRNILTIKGLHNYIPEDLYAAIQFIKSCQHKYPFESLVGAEYPLKELDRAFKVADKGDIYRVGVRP